jgi:hypothetical protein
MPGHPSDGHVRIAKPQHEGLAIDIFISQDKEHGVLSSLEAITVIMLGEGRARRRKGEGRSHSEE